MARILIADDQPEILHALKLLLKQEGFETVMVGSPEAVIREAESQAFDLIFIDLNYTRDTTSGREGLDLLGRLQALEYMPPVVVMTAWSTVPLAVEAMRSGAADFLQKPWENSRVLEIVTTQLALTTRGAGQRAGSKDLEIARSVQTKLLPQRRPELRTLDYAVKYIPAGQVGGDYYDFLATEDGLAFVVADVSGKGISAAILMATVQSFFRSRSPEQFRDLEALAQSLNALFYRSSPAEHYATVFLMRYSEPERVIHYVNCGHTSPLLAKRDGSSMALDSSATVLGLFEDWSGREERFHLDEGDTLLIFSDGLTEALDNRQQEFGTDRLMTLWKESKGLGAVELVTKIAESIRHHSGGMLSDDLTVLALRGQNSNPIGSDEHRRCGDFTDWMCQAACE
jgi:sigma-B regulation protein RsbU (phosphoserine phosphatase)